MDQKANGISVLFGPLAFGVFLVVSLPRLPASHKRCKVAWFGDAGGSETIETIPNIILQVHSATVTWNCWKYFGNLKRVTNTRDYQPTIHSGTQMWTCVPEGKK